MYEAVQKCTSCGAGLTLDDLRGTNCPYCKTVFPHLSQAAQHAQMAGMMMNQMMAQQAQVQNQWRAAYGMGAPQMPPAGPPGGPPPPMGAPPMGPPPGMPGAMPPPPGAPGSPYADPMRMAQVQMTQTANLGRTITLVVVISVLFVLVLTGGIVALAFMR
jgi:hypothetical protein